MNSFRVYMVNRKKVQIIERHTHTYVVQYVATGAICSVKKELVKSFIPKDKKPDKKPHKPTNNSQTKLDL